jgi:metal-sulfur cluster biosynthetic enzyme
MSVPPSIDSIRSVLDEIKDPCSVAASTPMGLDEMGLVRSLEITADGQVAVVLRLTSPFCEMVPFMRNQAIEKIRHLPGVAGVTVEHDSGLDWDPDFIAPAARERQRRRLRTLRELVTADRGLGGEAEPRRKALGRA